MARINSVSEFIVRYNLQKHLDVKGINFISALQKDVIK